MERNTFSFKLDTKLGPNTQQFQAHFLGNLMKMFAARKASRLPVAAAATDADHRRGRSAMGIFSLRFVTLNKPRGENTASPPLRKALSDKLTNSNYRRQVTAVTWSVLWVTPDGRVTLHDPRRCHVLTSPSPRRHDHSAKRNPKTNKPYFPLLPPSPCGKGAPGTIEAGVRCTSSGPRPLEWTTLCDRRGLLAHHLAAGVSPRDSCPH